MTNGDRRGFTLVELIVVIVLGALIVAASMEVLITNQRTYTAQNAQIQGQEATRAALDVLWGELRELSAKGGDLLTMGSDTMTVRVMRKFGIVCAVDTTVTGGSSGQPLLTAIKVGDWFDAKDSVFVFADNDESLQTDDYWIPAMVTQTDSTVSCHSQRAEQLVFAGQKTPFTNDSVRVGAPIRSYTRYTYGLFAYGGDYYLGRREPGLSAVPMVGPLKKGNGVQFKYMDSAGNVAATSTDVRQIQVTVRTVSNVRNSIGGYVADSVTTWIYTRN